MKLSKLFTINTLILFIFIIFILILNSNCFKFSSDVDDVIIKFNVENVKFKNNDYVNKIKNKVKKEMKMIKNKLSYLKLPDDLDFDSPVKIYEIQNSTILENINSNDNDQDDNGMNDFEEKDMIRSISQFLYVLNVF